MNHRAAHDPRSDAEWLTAALREQADQHEAQRRRVDARFEALTASTPGRARARSRTRLRSRRLVRVTRLRLIGVPLGLFAVVATATVAVGVSLGITTRTTHVPSQAAPASSPRPTAGNRQATPQGTTSAQRPAGTASAHTESSSPGPTASTGPLTAAGTVDTHSTQYWAQEDLTLTSTRVIRALHVVVTVSGGASVQSTGLWTTILAADVTTAVHQTSGGLVYEITLNPGQTLEPGSYAFGLQFNRPATGHDFALDTYNAAATTTDRAGNAGNTAGTGQVSIAGTFSQ
jgi:hypothetical protein